VTCDALLKQGETYRLG